MYISTILLVILFLKSIIGSFYKTVKNKILSFLIISTEYEPFENK